MYNNNNVKYKPSACHYIDFLKVSITCYTTMVQQCDQYQLNVFKWIGKNCEKILFACWWQCGCRMSRYEVDKSQTKPCNAS